MDTVTHALPADALPAVALSADALPADRGAEHGRPDRHARADRHRPEADPRPGTPQQAVLPFDQSPPVPLPYDDEAERPVAFRLTARARRVVAPEAVPSLTVVDGAPEDDRADTRPARARAMRRAGASVDEIAQRLRVDDLLVRAWVSDLPGDRPIGRAARAAAVLAAPADPVDARVQYQELARAGSSRPLDRDGATIEGPVGSADQVAARSEAVSRARRRLVEDPMFAAGVGLVAGLTSIDDHALGFRTCRTELASRLVGWLCDVAGARRNEFRVVLRLGAGAPADVARHRWARALGLGLDQISVTRSRPGHGDAIDEAFVRIADADVALRVSAWCETLLEPRLDPADAAF